MAWMTDDVLIDTRQELTLVFSAIFTFGTQVHFSSDFTLRSSHSRSHFDRQPPHPAGTANFNPGLDAR